MLSVSHVIGHNTHDDGAQVQEYVGQDLCGGAEDMDERNGGAALSTRIQPPCPVSKEGPVGLTEHWGPSRPSSLPRMYTPKVRKAHLPPMLANNSSAMHLSLLAFLHSLSRSFKHL